MLTRKSTPGANGGSRSFARRCWACGEVLVPHAAECRHCGASLTGTGTGEAMQFRVTREPRHGERSGSAEMKDSEAAARWPKSPPRSRAPGPTWEADDWAPGRANREQAKDRQAKDRRAEDRQIKARPAGDGKPEPASRPAAERPVREPPRPPEQPRPSVDEDAPEVEIPWRDGDFERISQAAGSRFEGFRALEEPEAAKAPGMPGILSQEPEPESQEPEPEPARPGERKPGRLAEDQSFEAQSFKDSSPKDSPPEVSRRESEPPRHAEGPRAHPRKAEPQAAGPREPALRRPAPRPRRPERKPDIGPEIGGFARADDIILPERAAAGRHGGAEPRLGRTHDPDEPGFDPTRSPEGFGLELDPRRPVLVPRPQHPRGRAKWMLGGALVALLVGVATWNTETWDGYAAALHHSLFEVAVKPFIGDSSPSVPDRQAATVEPETTAPLAGSPSDSMASSLDRADGSDSGQAGQTNPAPTDRPAPAGKPEQDSQMAALPSREVPEREAKPPRLDTPEPPRAASASAKPEPSAGKAPPSPAQASGGQDRRSVASGGETPPVPPADKPTAMATATSTSSTGDANEEASAAPPAPAPAPTAVRAVQRRLARLGYYGGAINGGFDSRTRYALHRFQRDAGFKRSDELGTALLRALEARVRQQAGQTVDIR